MGEFNNFDRPIKHTVDDAIEALSQDSQTLSVAVSYGLSDLSMEDLEKIKIFWKKMNKESKQRLVQHLVDLSESNFELNYHQFAFPLLDDDDGIVREAAIELLWENETVRLLHILIRIAQEDSITSVRAAAVNMMGNFILRGEYGKLNESEFAQVQDVVINIWNNHEEDILVRKRALESISNSSNEIVQHIITEAYNSDIHEFVVSAVYAMGKSYDAQWKSTVLDLLSSSDSELQYEATRACGELEIEEAIQPLTHLAVSDDREIQEMAIWSLGEIGGAAVTQILNRLMEDENFFKDNILLEALETALGNASVVDEMFDLSDFPDMDNLM